MQDYEQIVALDSWSRAVGLIATSSPPREALTMKALDWIGEALKEQAITLEDLYSSQEERLESNS
jgi:hypothetical protein